MTEDELLAFLRIPVISKASNFKNVVGIAGSGGDTGGDNDSKGDKKADGGKETLYQVGQFTSTY